MREFETVLIETLIIVTRLGIPLAIFFLIGYMIRSLAIMSKNRK